jgi:hypothetical protein
VATCGLRSLASSSLPQGAYYLVLIVVFPWTTFHLLRPAHVRCLSGSLAIRVISQLEKPDSSKRSLMPPRCAVRGAHRVAGLAKTLHLPDLTPVAPEAGAGEGDIRRAFTWHLGDDHSGPTRGYTPLEGGEARLVEGVTLPGRTCLGVWDTGTGALLRGLQCSPRHRAVWSLVTYRRPSGGRPRTAAGSQGGLLCIYDGEDYSTLCAIQTTPEVHNSVCQLIPYEDPTSGRTRLVTG